MNAGPYLPPNPPPLPNGVRAYVDALGKAAETRDDAKKTLAFLAQLCVRALYDARAARRERTMPRKAVRS